MLGLSTVTKKSPNDPITKEMLDEWVETILNGMKEIFAKYSKRFDKLDAERWKIIITL